MHLRKKTKETDLMEGKIIVAKFYGGKRYHALVRVTPPETVCAHTPPQPFRSIYTGKKEDVTCINCLRRLPWVKREV